MTSLRRFVSLGLILLVATSLLAWGQGPPPLDRRGHPGPPFGGPGGPPDPAMGLAGRILHDIDLSDAQKGQIHGLVRSHIDGELKSLIQDFGEARHQLENVVWDPKASDRDLAAASDALAQASLALEKGRRRLASDVLHTLTGSQQQRFHEMLAAAKPPGPPEPPPEEDPDTGR